MKYHRIGRSFKALPWAKCLRPGFTKVVTARVEQISREVVVDGDQSYATWISNGFRGGFENPLSNRPHIVDKLRLSLTQFRLHDGRCF